MSSQVDLDAQLARQLQEKVNASFQPNPSSGRTTENDDLQRAIQNSLQTYSQTMETTENEEIARAMEENFSANNHPTIQEHSIRDRFTGPIGSVDPIYVLIVATAVISYIAKAYLG